MCKCSVLVSDLYRFAKSDCAYKSLLISRTCLFPIMQTVFQFLNLLAQRRRLKENNVREVRDKGNNAFQFTLRDCPFSPKGISLSYRVIMKCEPPNFPNATRIIAIVPF